MEPKRLILGALLLAVMFFPISIIDWYVNNDYNSEGKAIEPEIALSEKEAKAIFNNFSYTKDYFWKQKSVVVNKRTLIPFYTKRDTLYKEQIIYYSREKEY